MKRVVIACSLVLIGAAAWFIMSGRAAADPQSTAANSRAAAAAQRVRPALERDLSSAGLRYGAPVFIRAFKEERLLELFVQHPDGKFRLFRSYPVVAASGGLGPKLAEGDNQVPEGFYAVPPQAMNPASRFHLAMNVGYPNAYDRAHHRTGSFIMIHGNQVSIGCLAMTDAKIEEIFTLCAAAHQNGQKAVPVHIFPFRMTAARLTKSSDSPWHSFWENLRQGYDAFEKTKLPPAVRVEKDLYQFH